MTEPAPEATLPVGTTLELAAALHVSDLPFGAAGKTTFGVARVGTDLTDLVTAHGAVIAVRQVGGLEQTWQTRARLTLDVYAATYSDAWAAQNALTAHIGHGWRPNTTAGDGGIPIDSWKNESAPAEQPYPGLTVITSIWRVTTRHMPA